MALQATPPKSSHKKYNDTWYLPENPEFAYECIIRIQGSRVGVQVVMVHYEFRGRRVL
jgi:hypothetical protein